MLNKILLSISYYLLRIYLSTFKYKIVGERYLDEPLEKGFNVIFALWHCHLLPLAYYHRGKEIATIVSESKDGEIGTYVLNKLDYQTVRGSSSKGGVRAVIHAKRLMAKGYNAAVTLDGPKGPRFKVKPGAVYLAKISGFPIVPIVFSCKKFKQLGSWDKLIIPLPFSEINVYYGSPIFLNSDRGKVSMEKDSKLLEKKMMELTFAHSKDHCKDII